MSKQNAYNAAGVDIDAAEKAVELMKKPIASTHTRHVVGTFGQFAGMISIKSLGMHQYRNPILVHKVDGVGTKSIVAEIIDKLDTIGEDVVNHCINDIATLGAKPFAFLDYIGCDVLKPREIATIVSGMAKACRENSIAFIGGETAEMADVYREGRHAIVGVLNGIVERSKIIDGSRIKAGDVLIGFESNGLHTNGYSLARKFFFQRMGYDPSRYVEELGCTVAEELLKVHRCYLRDLDLLYRASVRIHGIAHITGGGFYKNIERIMPKGLCAEISEEWPIPSVFRMIQRITPIAWEEMARDFNLGIGMVLVVSQKEFEKFPVGLSSLTWQIGEVKKAKKNEPKVILTAYQGIK